MIGILVLYLARKLHADSSYKIILCSLLWQKDAGTPIIFTIAMSSHCEVVNKYQDALCIETFLFLLFYHSTVFLSVSSLLVLLSATHIDRQTENHAANNL